MKRKKNHGIAKRIMAVVLAVFLLIGVLPVSTREVSANTAGHENYITIKVVDGESNPIEGVTVNYTIEKDPEFVGGVEFTPVNLTKSTDVDGVVDVLDSTLYQADCLKISATVSMNGYITDNTTVSGRVIASDNEEIVVTLQPSSLPTITATVDVLDGTYQEGVSQPLVTTVTPNVSGATIEYSTNNTDWSTEVPSETNAGDYPVYVRVSKTGYTTFTSEELTAKIKKADISGITVEANTLYYNGEQQKLVTLSGTQDGDEISWKVNSTATGSSEIPKEMAVGVYAVELTVHRGDNYNDFVQPITAEIKNGKITLGGLTVKGVRTTYNGAEQDAVIVNNQGDTYQLKYKIKNSDGVESGWSDQIPKVIDAGSYTVWVKAVKENYDDADVDVEPAEGAETSYNVYVAMASQILTFNYSYENSYDVEVDILESEGKTFDFSATDVTNKTGNTITYTFDVSEGYDSDCVTLDTDGNLTFKKPGEVKVTATLPGNRNYEECKIYRTIAVNLVTNADGKLIAFENGTVNYVLGQNNGVVSTNKATRKKTHYRGTITHSIENASALGLTCDADTGRITISDYAKLTQAVINANGNLNIVVKADKAKAWKCDADSVSYILTIRFMDIADNSCILKIGENVVTGPDGTNDWYKSEVTVLPENTTDYEIAKLNANMVFADSVVFGNVVDGTVQDQGITTKKVLLKDKSTGGISAPIEVPVTKLDNVKPDGLAIDFPNRTPLDSILFFKNVDITFTAYDTTSGIDKFTWEYTRESGASSNALETTNGTITAIQDADDATKYTAVLTLPRNAADQLRGNLKITAIDKAGNVSDAYTDTGVFVVDTNSPTSDVSYSLVDNTKPINTVGNLHYTQSDIKFVFKVTETNFYADDIDVKVSKDGAAAVKQTLAWEATENEDEYQASITLSGDGKYVVSMSYEDRSGNKMEDFVSDTFVIDTTIPVIEFKYADYQDTVNPQTATITIKELNFNPKDFVLDIDAKDITGKEIQAGDLQAYIRNSTWTSEGDVHTIQVSTRFVEGIYNLKLNYSDLAGNNAHENRPDEFIVDRTAPDAAKMQISYSASLKDAVLSSITFGYYNPNVTVTFTAFDSVTGIDYFTWEYIRQSGASNTNVANYAQANVEAKQDASDKTKFTATVTLPKSQADQLRGTVSFTATDKYGNLSDKKTDDNHVIIVDTIAPTIRAEYTAPVAKPNEKNYYNNSITATFTVTEANFYKEDVKVTLERKNGGTAQVDLNWTDNNSDVHVGTYTISEANGDDEYIFNVSYTDRSNNTMTAYKSEIFVLDTKAPTINVEYSNPVQTENGIAYYDGSINVTMNVKEVNFNSADMVVTVTKDGTAFAPTVTWTTTGEENVGTFALTEDGDYTVSATYKDLATNAMEDYSSEQMVIDTELNEPTITINGEDGNGKAYKEEVIPAIEFEDKNFASCEVTLVRTSYADKNVDVTGKFISGHLTINDNGGSGRFDTFEKVADNDGIYTLSVSLEDKAGHTVEKEVTFTVNRFGSVYEYSDYLISLIADGGAYVQKVDNDIVITEYNADKLLTQSVNIVISKDGKPVDDTAFSVTPEVNENVAIGESGWYQYQYTISKDNFATDGVYKVAISSEDATGNTPENSNYDDKGILFRVDSTAPEITSITGLEDKVVNATEQEVKYTVYDTIGLASVSVYVNDSELTRVTDFGDDYNNYQGAFVLAENTESQKVRLVVTDKAGNVTDTSDEAFTSVYAFNDSVTVSTNVFVRFFANKTLVFGTIAGVGGVGAGGAGLTVFFRRRKLKVK